MSNKAVILDRDGVINKDVAYPHKLADLEILPGAAEGLKKFQEAGYLLIIITNQSGIGRGYFTQDDFDKFNQTLFFQLESQGIKINALYVCPHHPDDHCQCRKPKADLLFKAKEDYGLDLSQCIIVGDSERDFFSQIDGYQTAWIKNSQTPCDFKTDYEVGSLEELANLIIQ